MERFFLFNAVADLRGAPGTRAPPTRGQNSFIFMQFSTQKIGSRTHFGSWRPPPGENPGSATVMESFIHKQRLLH